MTRAIKTGMVMYGKYSNIVEYEYRGKTYEVEYAKGLTYCCAPAKVQHEDAQRKIDNMIDNPSKAGKTFDLNEVWDLLGWD